jgi:hypothetical protein
VSLVRTLALALVLGLPLTGSAFAQDNEEAASEAASDEHPEGELDSDLELAAKSENPVSDIVRLPIVNSTFFGIGPRDQVGNALLFAPIVPFLFDGDWSIVTRTIIPVITRPDLAAGSGRTTGLGDITLEVLGHKLFRSRRGQMFDLALGPIAGFPSASREVLRSGKWKLGPKLVAGVTAKRWVALLLVRNLWSVGGDPNRRDVNALLLQYLLFYNFPKGWYLAMEPIITADWTQSGTDRWTVPFGIGVGKFFRIRRVPITTRAQAFYNAVRPDFGAKWELRVTLVLIKPNPLRFTK